MTFSAGKDCSVSRTNSAPFAEHKASLLFRHYLSRAIRLH